MISAHWPCSEQTVRKRSRGRMTVYRLCLQRVSRLYQGKPNVHDLANMTLAAHRILVQDHRDADCLKILMAMRMIGWSSGEKYEENLAAYITSRKAGKSHDESALGVAMLLDTLRRQEYRGRVKGKTVMACVIHWPLSWS